MENDAAVLPADSVPYQPKVFRDFIALVGRLFYDDSSIVLLDFFAREQRAFTESEMKDKLRWRDVLLHQKLSGLEKQLLVERVVETERGAKSVQLWRIHSHVFVAVAWRLRSLEESLQEEVRKASNRNDFLCVNCGRRVTVLDAAAGPRALEDDHPLCRLCGTPLTTADSEEARQVAEDKLKRAYVQLNLLKESLQRVGGMAVPEFSAAASSSSVMMNESSSFPLLMDSQNLQTPPQSSTKPTPATSSSGLLNDSRAIPWFGDNVKPMAATVAPDAGSGSEVSAPRMAFGTGGSGITKPAAFRLPTSFDSLKVMPQEQPRQVVEPAITKPVLKAPAAKPFSMTIKTKSVEGKGSSVAGSSVTGPSREGAPKRKGLEIFGTSGKKIKL
eukprot:Protomagalhaensia_sp_Gyna_25__5184@NODE_618_length_2997_cov_8_486477_g479_i0_p1_GENE_NODE_618_length_2997_cov_8_486477_g479_i0NODE_618_length_2997_cov_8_486477_g479_i0_p1_ORF_typecomplete_len387_score73_97TFIIE_alpha/PF02002_17/8_6e07DZR/PF12773_7/0_33CTU2/PF10288_9/0_43_NODE_618_length_2997_cov_8_486477_g479_i013432503